MIESKQEGSRDLEKALRALKQAKEMLMLAKQEVHSAQHLRKVSDRTALQSADNAEKFFTTRKIDSFESPTKFTADREQKYQQLETVHLSKGAETKPIEGAYAEPFTERREDNAETVESRNTVIAIRV